MRKDFLDRGVIPIITGPTASGKSSLAIELARECNGVIVSADSRQIYKECSIGTARATDEELNGVEISLSGHRCVTDNYSVGLWLKEVKEQVDAILASGKLPIIAGGTPFYIHSLLNGIFEDTDAIDVPKELRDELTIRWNSQPEQLYNELSESDPAWASKIEQNDRQRIMRGLEYFRTTGKRLSDSFENHINIFEEYNFELYIITRDRQELYDRINRRVDVMITMGLEAEVVSLYKTFGDFDKINGLKSVGYSEWIPYFNGERSKDEVIELIKRNSRRYAKRQLTFFNNKFPTAVFIEL